MTTAVERYQQLMTDPCWQQEMIYLVGRPVIDMLNNGEITEQEIPLYAISCQHVWKNVCEETAVDET